LHARTTRCDLAWSKASLGGGTLDVIVAVAWSLDGLGDPDRLDIARDILKRGPVLPLTSGPLAGSSCPLSTAVGSLEERESERVGIIVRAEVGGGFHRLEGRDVVAGTIDAGYESLAGTAVLFLGIEIDPAGLRSGGESDGGSSGNERELHRAKIKQVGVG